MSDPLSLFNQPPAPPEPPNPYAPPTALDMEPGAAPEPGVPLEPVGFWPRAFARLLDLGVHMILGLVAGVFVGITVGVIAAARGVPFATLWAGVQPATWMAFLGSLLGSMLYQVILAAGHGSSLGKLLLGIVVIEENGRPCSAVQALKRELAYFVDALFFGLIAASQMSKSPLKQRLGDDWADTVVVRRRSAPRHSLRSGLQFFGVFCLAAAADVVALGLPHLIRIVAA